MKIEKIEIEKLKFAEYNPRTITKEEFEGLKASIKKFGDCGVVVINSDFTIIAGHQRVRAFQELGYKEIECRIVSLNKHDEKELNILLNSPKISGSYDNIKLAEILDELRFDNDYKELRLDALEPIDLNITENDLTEEIAEREIKLLITFKTIQDMEKAKIKIEELLQEFRGSYLTVSLAKK